MFVLGVQTPRSPTAAALGFLGISIELRILEAFVHALARTTLSTPVQSVDARMVAHYFGIRAKNRQAKKKAAVELVGQLLSQVEHQTHTPLVASNLPMVVRRWPTSTHAHTHTHTHTHTHVPTCRYIHVHVYVIACTHMYMYRHP